MSQQFKIGKHKTRIFIDELGFKCVRYCDTIIFKFKDNKIVLNNGGYFTATTKTRINQAFNQFGFPFSLFQQKYKWYIKNRLNDTIILYENDMELIAN